MPRCWPAAAAGCGWFSASTAAPRRLSQWPGPGSGSARPPDGGSLMSLRVTTGGCWLPGTCHSHPRRNLRRIPPPKKTLWVDLGSGASCIWGGSTFGFLLKVNFDQKKFPMGWSKNRSEKERCLAMSQKKAQKFQFWHMHHGQNSKNVKKITQWEHFHSLRVSTFWIFPENPKGRSTFWIFAENQRGGGPIFLEGVI